MPSYAPRKHKTTTQPDTSERAILPALEDVYDTTRWDPTAKQPMRPPNSFILFRAWQTHTRKDEEWKLNGGPSVQLASEWALASDEVKDHFQRLSELLRVKHKQIYPRYKFKPHNIRSNGHTTVGQATTKNSSRDKRRGGAMSGANSGRAPRESASTNGFGLNVPSNDDSDNCDGRLRPSSPDRINSLMDLVHLRSIEYHHEDDFPFYNPEPTDTQNDSDFYYTDPTDWNSIAEAYRTGALCDLTNFAQPAQQDMQAADDFMDQYMDFENA